MFRFQAIGYFSDHQKRLAYKEVLFHIIREFSIRSIRGNVRVMNSLPAQFRQSGKTVLFKDVFGYFGHIFSPESICQICQYPFQTDLMFVGLFFPRWNIRLFQKPAFILNSGGSLEPHSLVAYVWSPQGRGPDIYDWCLAGDNMKFLSLLASNIVQISQIANVLVRFVEEAAPVSNLTDSGVVIRAADLFAWENIFSNSCFSKKSKAIFLCFRAWASMCSKTDKSVRHLRQTDCSGLTMALHAGHFSMGFLIFLYESLDNLLDYFHSLFLADLEDFIPSQPVAVIWNFL